MTFNSIKTDKIFIQMASYRDKDLINTVRNCINQAEYPANLIFGIAWYRDETENLEEFINDSRFKIIDMDYKESKGVCYARNMINKLYDCEEYTLYLDAHHRFIENWDTILISMYKKLFRTGYKNPLITAHLPNFDSNNDYATGSKKEKVLHKMESTILHQSGLPILSKKIMIESELIRPRIAKFCSDHFLFTAGKFCIEVPHDPNIYFFGRELNISIRAYTYGYNLFHPNSIVAWHDYARDNKEKNNLQENELEECSIKYIIEFIKKLKTKKLIEEYGVGKIKDIFSYEKLIGGTLLGIGNCIEEKNENYIVYETTPYTKEFKRFDVERISWIENCIKNLISKEDIFKILLNCNYKYDDIVETLNYIPINDKIIQRRKNQMEMKINNIFLMDPLNKKLVENPNAVRIENNFLELYTIDNFITHDECDEVINCMINFTSSRVTDPNDFLKSRTSSTCAFKSSTLLHDISDRISKTINIENYKSEYFQGLKYEIGQEYKHHVDFFHEESKYEIIHLNRGGQRTWTFMIYLSDVEEGGDTDFININVSFKPKKGMAVIWNNLINNYTTGNEYSKHGSIPVIKGVKYVVTKWFRKFKHLFQDNLI